MKYKHNKSTEWYKTTSVHSQQWQVGPDYLPSMDLKLHKDTDNMTQEIFRITGPFVRINHRPRVNGWFLFHGSNANQFMFSLLSNMICFLCYVQP